MKIVKIEQQGFPVGYVSGYSYRGYAVVSDVWSSPVRAHATLFDNDETAEQAADFARRGGRCTVTVVEAQ